MIKTGNLMRFLVTSAVLMSFVAVGYYFGQKSSQTSRLQTLFASPAFAGTVFANYVPDNASGGKALSMATGIVEAGTGIEALYGLDHLTGDLFCWVLNPNTGQVGSVFTVSARKALEVTDADTDFVMTTGTMDFASVNTGNALRPANSVVYIGEGNSGKVAGFVLMYDRRSINSGIASAGELKLIAEIVTRNPNARRDQ